MWPWKRDSGGQWGEIHSPLWRSLSVLLVNWVTYYLVNDWLQFVHTQRTHYKLIPIEYLSQRRMSQRVTGRNEIRTVNRTLWEWGCENRRQNTKCKTSVWRSVPQRGKHITTAVTGEVFRCYTSVKVLISPFKKNTILK